MLPQSITRNATIEKGRKRMHKEEYDNLNPWSMTHELTHHTQQISVFALDNKNV